MEIKLTKELDRRLRAFINAPTNFLDALGLVNAFHGEKVLASTEPYAITVEGKEVVPVFTTQEDLVAFQEAQASSRDKVWAERSALEVLAEAIRLKLHGLAFNLKKTGDMGNSTLIKTSDMISFVNHHTQILNLVLGEKNQQADLLDKVYLIPGYNRKDKDGNLVRFFAMMTNPEGKHYVPVFSNLVSFAKWYNDAGFGGKFRELEGVIFTWPLKQLRQPKEGQHMLEETTGFAVNPFDPEMVLFDWESLPE